jgi:glycosyltransferase involved in cell wall biosynthesis
LIQWRDYALHARSGWKDATQAGDHSGIVTCFPQLALMVGLRKKMSRRRLPVVAWTFNLGHVPQGVMQRIASVGLAQMDRIVVHSRSEVDIYARCFGLPRERFQFVPLQAPERQITIPEDREHPYVIAMGSARRDYPLLVDALSRLGLPATIVAAPHALEGIRIPDNIQVKSSLTQQQCFELLQAARLHVIPIRNTDTASGQVTLVESMSHKRPTIVTRCLATVDYAVDREEVRFVPQGDVAALTDAIAELWGDESLRARMSERAFERARREFSDEAIGKVLQEVLDGVT